MRSVRHQVDVNEWQQRILARQSSGLSVRKWCADNSIQESRYYYWLQTLRNEELALRKPDGVFAELQLNSRLEERERMSTGICAVIRHQGLCLEICNGADPTTLEATMRALGVGR